MREDGEQSAVRKRKAAVCIQICLLLLLSACTDPMGKRGGEESQVMSTQDLTVEPTGTDVDVFSCDAVFFGDSITADSDFGEYYPRLSLVNLGVYGDTLEDLQRRVKQVRAENPARIFLMGGINSLRDGNSKACLQQYRGVLEALRAACPRAKIILQSVLPVGADIESLLGCHNDTVRAFNAGLRSLAAEYGCSYVDLYSAYEKDGALDPALTRDGVHLNYNAYGPWAEAIASYLPAN